MFSHRRAAQAINEGRFQREIVPCKGKSKTGEDVTLTADEGVRAGTTAAKLAKLKLLKKGKGGVLTAATSSQITDGASAILICNEAGLAKLGVTPRAKIVCQTVVGSDPILMLYGPIPVRLFFFFFFFRFFFFFFFFPFFFFSVPVIHWISIIFLCVFE